MAEKFKPYNVVVIDESESICAQLFSSTISIDKIINFNYLQDTIIARANKIVLLDRPLEFVA